jgi:protein-tyrosine phosphatase
VNKLERVDGLYNFRDLGGIETDTGHIAPGLLYRSEALAGLTPEGKRELESSALGLVLDLRSDQEIQMLPDPVLDGVANVHIPMLSGAMPEDKAAIQSQEKEHKSAIELLRKTYFSLVAHNGRDYVNIIHQTAQAISAGKSTLIHCSAGKDRTGTSIAFILTLAGAKREQIVADYASSQTNLSGAWQNAMLSAIERSGVTVPDAIKPTMIITPPELIEEVLTHIDDEFGSVAEYLLANGMKQQDIDILRKTLRVD